VKKVNYKKRAEKIKLIAMDIDGVLTGGEIIILNSGEEIKIWDAKDRIAFRFARSCGKDFKFVWITGRRSDDVIKRSEELKINELFLGCINKLEAYDKVKEKYGLDDSEIAYIGDDLVDMPVLKKAGLAVCPLDAPEDVKDSVHYISRYPGGKGVFRETVEIILRSQGLWKGVVDGFSN